MSEGKESDYRVQLERKYQNEIIKIFTEQLHYTYLGNLSYGKDSTVNSKNEKNSNILIDEVKKFLNSPDSERKYTQNEIDQAINKLKKHSGMGTGRFDDLLQTNNETYDILITNEKAKDSEKSYNKSVKFFNFTNYKSNNFAIAEEVSYIDPVLGKNSRPDLVIYVNGIALAVIELKRSLVSIEEGIKQNLSNEKDLIPSFFTTVQFTIAASDKNGFEYGTIGTPRKFWCPWKKNGTIVGKDKIEENNPPLNDKEAFLSFFDKDTFMQMFRYGVIDDGGKKKVMRPHQHWALHDAIPRLRDKSDGVIWHSQGAGKSLFMVWLAKYISANFDDPRVLVITDRTELDSQIKNAFLRSSEDIHQAKSSDDLLDTLKGNTEWLICSLIHKFGRHIDPTTGEEIVGDDDAPIPLEKYLEELQNILKKKYPDGFSAKGTNKFVFVDECHRTQGGRLHEAMRAIMGNDVMFIGFTGTPLLKEQKKNGGFSEYKKAKNTSEVRFGEFIHTYLHKEAVEDKVILDLEYEGRDVEQQITNKQKLDAKLDEILNDVAEENQQQIKDRWATLEKVYSSKERIERIGYSIIDDMNTYPLNQDWCNAILVAGNIYSAYKYYEFFQQNNSDQTLKNKCAVVTSFTPTDNDIRKLDDGTDNRAEYEAKFKHNMALKSFEDAGVKDGEAYETWAKKKFTEQPANMKLLIVVDKLLTGFDAQSATYLYIDRDMRDHNLFQAICRVNRLGEDIKRDKENPDSEIIFTHKEFGKIVDFKILFDNIQKAVDRFNGGQGALNGYDPEDVEGLLEDALIKNSKKLLSAKEAFDALRSTWEQLGLYNNDDLVNYYKDKEKEDRIPIYQITAGYVCAYSNIADMIRKAGFSKEEASNFHKLCSEASAINLRLKQACDDDFNVKEYDPKMRALLDRFISADDAEIIIPAEADFSFLDLITETTNVDDIAKKAEQEAGSKDAAAEKIEARVRSVINNWSSKDDNFALKFSERLENLLNDAKTNRTDNAKKINDLIEMLKDLKKGPITPDGINTPFEKALWNNKEKWTSLEGEELIGMIRTLSVVFKNHVFANWKDLTSRDGKLCLKRLADILQDSSNNEQILEVHRLAANNL